MEEDPADPSRYEKTSLAQVYAADRELFAELSRRNRRQIARRADGTYPLEADFDQILAGARIEALLSPLAKSDRASSAKNKPTTVDGVSKALSDIKSVLGALKSEGSNRRAAEPGSDNTASKPSKRTKRGKGGNQGKLLEGKSNLPAALRGCLGALDNGDRICYSFNIDGCSKASSGQKCDRGWHVCCESVNGSFGGKGKACGKPHARKDHK